jgi:hypothetical protein
MRMRSVKINTMTLRSGNVLFGLGVILFLFTLLSCSVNKEEKTTMESPIPDSVYVQAGNTLVSHTFDTLRSALLNAIGSHGMEGAITFCNEKAFPITAIYADSVVIKRAAMRYRNPDNQPDSLESAVMEEMERQLISGVPTVKMIRSDSSDEIHFFKPILLQAMCLNCHGNPGQDIQSSTLSRIQQLYPDDRAVNFKEGDLRGVWHIIFKSPKK